MKNIIKSFEDCIEKQFGKEHFKDFEIKGINIALQNYYAQFKKDKKFLHHMIHEHNTAVSLLNNQGKYLKYHLNNDIKITEEKINNHLDTLEDSKKLLEYVFDKMYEKIKIEDLEYKDSSFYI